MSYESPINIIYEDMQTKLEGDVFKAIQNCNIEVDKDELLKALAYDRNQYQKGWSDGYAQAAEDIVHCNNCKWWKTNYTWSRGKYNICAREAYEPLRNGEDFCSYGERRKDE